MPLNDCVVQNQLVPVELVSRLRDSTDDLGNGVKLSRQIDDEGYVFLRGVLDQDAVLAARDEVFGRLMEVGEIKPPPIDGIVTGQSQRREMFNDLGVFWRSVSEGPVLRRVTHGARARKTVDAVFGEPARPQDYLWLRPGAVGCSTGLHYDYPFFAYKANRVCIVWMALGDIHVCEGPLMIVEGSNKFTDLIDSMRSDDDKVKLSPKDAQQAAYQSKSTDDVLTFVRARNTRLLTEDFQAGDLVVFSLFVLHGACDNHSPISRARLSCDVRWQRASDSIDERYFGSNLTGALGNSYADMRSAQPLAEPWKRSPTGVQPHQLTRHNH